MVGVLVGGTVVGKISKKGQAMNLEGVRNCEGMFMKVITKFMGMGARSVKVAALAAVAAGVWMAPLAGAADEPLRKGVGEARKALDEMERKPFDHSVWSKLGDWQNGEAPSGASTAGKVVLIVAYSDWYRPAQRAMRSVQKLSEAHGKEGLIVVAAHASEGWAEAPKAKPAEGATLLLAHDEKGEFRTALKIDQDPAFYLIDRAGQLRYANITNESVDGAVAELLKESGDDAAGVNDRLAEAKRRAAEEARRTASIRQSISLASIPELPFTAASAEEMEKVEWIKPPKDENNSSTEEPKAKQVTLPEEGWVPKKPATNGRMYILYFFHPKIHVSYDKIIDEVELLQKQHGRDAVCVGVLTNFTNLTESNDSEAAKKYALTPEEAKAKCEEFIKSKSLTHSMIIDLEGSILKAITSENRLPAPYVAVLSSDQMARWWGWSRAPGFKGAMSNILSVDPNVIARRKVEQTYILEKNKK